MGSAKRAAFTLIEILVVVVVLMILAAIIMPHYLGGTTMDGKKVKSPLVVTNDAKCQLDLQQVRAGIMTLKTGESESDNPKNLDDLKLPSELLHCPVGGEAYVYSPETGEIHCPHPGHERY